MKKVSKWVPPLAVAVLFCLGLSQAGNSAPADPAVTTFEAHQAVSNLTGLTLEQVVAGQTDIVLALDGPAAFESMVLEGPDRLVLDLQGVVTRLDEHKIAVDRDGVVRVRTAQHDRSPHPVTRIVFDLERPLPYTINPRGDDLVISFGVTEVGLGIETAASVGPQDVAKLVAELEARNEPAAAEIVPPTFSDPSRRVEADLIEQLLNAPTLAAPTPQSDGGSGEPAVPTSFKTKRIVTSEVVYSGKEISLNLVDADLKQVFRLFHDISGLNFVLDPSVGGNVTIVLDKVPWDQALDIILKNNSLDKQYENNVVRIASTNKLAQEAAERKQLKEAKELEVEPITITRTLSYAKSKDVERVIRESGVLSGRGRVIVDERTNTLIISDIPKKVSPLDELISTLDAETPQVMIEARIVETSRDFVQDLGVIWGFSAIADSSLGTSTGLTFPHNASVKYGLNLPGDGGASALAFKFGNVLDSFTLDLTLNTLETEGHGRVLSSPKIATQNNERAEIEQGVRIPIVNTTATEINVEFVSASLRMEVTPQITAEGTIILDVTVENNSPDFVNRAGDIPSIRTQRAQTKVLISDGGTTVIGGIFTVNEGRSEVGVPWFRKLPVFGWLFKQQNITNQNRELLIFITPKIMRVS